MSIPFAGGPLLCASPCVPAAQHYGIHEAPADVAWPGGDLDPWRALKDFQQRVHAAGMHPLTSEPPLPVAAGGALPGVSLRIRIGQAVPPDDILYYNGYSAEDWVLETARHAIVCLATGPNAFTIWEPHPFSAWMLDCKRHPRRTSIVLGVLPTVEAAAKVAVLLRAGSYCLPHTPTWPHPVHLPVEAVAALSEPYHVELVLHNLHASLAYPGVAAVLLTAAGYEVAEGSPGRGQVQVVSERLAPGPDVEAILPRCDFMKACIRVGAGVDPALVQLPRQVCYQYGTLRLVVYKPRPDPSPAQQPARVDRVGVGGAQPAPPGAPPPAPPQPAAVQGGTVQPPQPQPAQPSAFRRGDYVLVRGCHEPLRVESVGPLGVVILVARNGARSRRRAAVLRAYTEAVDPPIQPQRFQARHSTPCEMCDKRLCTRDRPMMLCEGCNTGCHVDCAGLAENPEDDWVCPHCCILLGRLDPPAAGGAPSLPPGGAGTPPSQSTPAAAPWDVAAQAAAVACSPTPRAGLGSPVWAAGGSSGASESQHVEPVDLVPPPTQGGPSTPAAPAAAPRAAALQGGGRARRGAQQQQQQQQGRAPQQDSAGTSQPARPPSAPDPPGAPSPTPQPLQPRPARQPERRGRGTQSRQGRNPQQEQPLEVQQAGPQPSAQQQRRVGGRQQYPQGGRPQPQAGPPLQQQPQQQHQQRQGGLQQQAGPPPRGLGSSGPPGTGQHASAPLPGTTAGPDGAAAGVQRMEVDSRPSPLGRRSPDPPTVSPAAKRPAGRPSGGSGLRVGFLNRSPGPQEPQRRRTSSGGASSSGSDTYGVVLVGRRKQALLAALRGPPEPPGALADPEEGLCHHALWQMRDSYEVCASSAGRAELLAYLRGDVDQWRRIRAEGPPEGPLPTAARAALAEAAAALQAELDVAQLAGGGR